MGSSANQATQAAGGVKNTGGMQQAVMPVGFGGLSTPKTLPPQANTTGGAQQMPAVMPQQPRMVQPTGPNIFQQSSGALNQAQQTLGNLAQFQPQAMQTAQFTLDYRTHKNFSLNSLVRMWGFYRQSKQFTVFF